jgi:hypothetical protein
MALQVEREGVLHRRLAARAQVLPVEDYCASNRSASNRDLSDSAAPRVLTL